MQENEYLDLILSNEVLFLYNGDMLKKGKMCITVLLLLSMMIPRVYAEEVEIDLQSSNAVLISSVSGSVLYGKEEILPVILAVWSDL